MSETHHRLVTVTTHHPSHKAHHSSLHATHHATTTYPHTPVHQPTTTTSSTEAGTSKFSYPTPSSIPRGNTAIMCLSITVAFLVIILGAMIATIVLQRRSKKRVRQEYVRQSAYLEQEDDGYAESAAAPSEGRKHRTWKGLKIVPLVPSNGYASERA